MPETNQVFEGWAMIEMMGHRKEIGFVTTQAFGQAVMFRVDTPAIPEREYKLARPEYVDHSYRPIGTKVRRPAVPARSCLVAPGALYAINPCTEEAARAAIEREFRPALMLVGLPESMALASGEEPEQHCGACGCPLDLCDCADEDEQDDGL